jgi:hypothetical protein
MSQGIFVNCAGVVQRKKEKQRGLKKNKTIGS